MSQNNSNNRGNNPRRRRPNNGTRKNNTSGSYQDQRSKSPHQPGKVPNSGQPLQTPASTPPSPLQKFLNMVTFGMFGKKSAAPVPGKAPYPKTDERPANRSRNDSFPERASGSSQEEKRGENRDRGASRPSDSGASRESRPPREPREQREPRESKPAPALEPPTSERLYVGNLSYEATEQDLTELFKGVGNVRNAEVVINNRTQRSKGYAFVTMNTPEEARRAYEVLHNQPFMGRQLVVGGAKASNSNQEQEKEESPAEPEVAA